MLPKRKREIQFSARLIWSTLPKWNSESGARARFGANRKSTTAKSQRSSRGDRASPNQQQQTDLLEMSAPLSIPAPAGVIVDKDSDLVMVHHSLLLPVDDAKLRAQLLAAAACSLTQLEMVFTCRDPVESNRPAVVAELAKRLAAAAAVLAGCNIFDHVVSLRFTAGVGTFCHQTPLRVPAAVLALFPNLAELTLDGVGLTGGDAGIAKPALLALRILTVYRAVDDEPFAATLALFALDPAVTVVTVLDGVDVVVGSGGGVTEWMSPAKQMQALVDAACPIAPDEDPLVPVWRKIHSDKLPAGVDVPRLLELGLIQKHGISTEKMLTFKVVPPPSVARAMPPIFSRGSSPAPPSSGDDEVVGRTRSCCADGCADYLSAPKRLKSDV